MFLFIKYNCHSDCGESHQANMEAYWCAASGPVQQNSGYLFGGVYTDGTVNPVTNDKSCPDHYIALKFGTTTKMYVCISDDNELGFRYSVPFGGFFSCQAGNPLTLRNNLTASKVTIRIYFTPSS